MTAARTTLQGVCALHPFSSIASSCCASRKSALHCSMLTADSLALLRWLTRMCCMVPAKQSTVTHSGPGLMQLKHDESIPSDQAKCSKTSRQRALPGQIIWHAGQCSFPGVLGQFRADPPLGGRERENVHFMVCAYSAMAGPSPSDVEVTQEDQHKINAFGRLNVRMHELKNAITTTQVGRLCRRKLQSARTQSLLASWCNSSKLPAFRPGRASLPAC